MENLIKLSERKGAGVKASFKRFLYLEIDREQPLSIILGHRGTGKTHIAFTMDAKRRKGDLS
jgi:hypothetical protein